jgi:acyl-ACP thioesterase
MLRLLRPRRTVRRVERAEPLQLIAPPADGRVFSLPRRPGLGDCAPSGRLRLDAIARWLQDVAYGDVEDAGLHEAAVWVVRKYRIRVERFPRFGEAMVVRTFCSGIGRMWAERRTTVAPAGPVDPARLADGSPGEPDQAGIVEAVAVWVHLDPVSRMPAPLTAEEIAIYGGTGSERTVSARLRHPPPEAGLEPAAWAFRSSDLDIADHVNNAAYWLPFEEELIAGAEPTALDVEMEFRAPAQPGEKHLLANGKQRWITSVDGEVHGSLLISELARSA